VDGERADYRSSLQDNPGCGFRVKPEALTAICRAQRFYSVVLDGAEEGWRLCSPRSSRRWPPSSILYKSAQRRKGHSIEIREKRGDRSVMTAGGRAELG
jgi:hypothetical protein